MERGLTLQDAAARPGHRVGVLAAAEADRWGRRQRHRVRARPAAIRLAGGQSLLMSLIEDATASVVEPCRHEA